MEQIDAEIIDREQQAKFWASHEQATETLGQFYLRKQSASKPVALAHREELAAAWKIMTDNCLSLSMVYAVSIDDVIGIGNRLPWYIPSDLKRFKRLTMFRTLIVGAKTWEAMPWLEDRPVIVVGRTHRIVNTIMTTTTIDEAIKLASLYRSKEVMVIGGGTIFEMFAPLVSTRYVTTVHQSYDTLSDMCVIMRKPTMLHGVTSTTTLIESTASTINQPMTTFKVTRQSSTFYEASVKNAARAAETARKPKTKKLPANS